MEKIVKAEVSSKKCLSITPCILIQQKLLTIHLTNNILQLPVFVIKNLLTFKYIAQILEMNVPQGTFGMHIVS